MVIIFSLLRSLTNHHCSFNCVLLIGYQLEKRSPVGDWEKVNDVPIVGESAVVPDLVEGESYEFRVAAVTEAGVGEYSNATPMTKAEKKKRTFWSKLATKFDLIVSWLI